MRLRPIINLCNIKRQQIVLTITIWHAAIQYACVKLYDFDEACRLRKI